MDKNKDKYKLNYICSICGLKINVSGNFHVDDLLSHKKKSQNSVVTLMPKYHHGLPMRLTRIRDVGWKIPESWDCPKCEMRFHDIGLLSAHQLTHKDSGTSLNKKLHEKPMFKEVSIENGGPGIECPQCEQKFDNIDAAKNHHLTHAVEVHRLGVEILKSCDIDIKEHTLDDLDLKPHKCEVCELAFSGVDSLKEHELLHVDDRTQYECPVCRQSFFDEAIMKKHQLIHMHKCPECESWFNEEKDLASHQLSHSVEVQLQSLEEHKTSYADRLCMGRMIYMCKVCGKRFLKKVNLERHQVIHADEKPLITCKECGENFRWEHELKRHKLTHRDKNPHACRECGERFRWQHDLKRHQARHVRLKLCVCPECGKSFLNTFKMKEHLMVHTGVKPHICPACGQRFRTKGQMKLHLSTHKNGGELCCDKSS